MKMKRSYLSPLEDCWRVMKDCMEAGRYFVDPHLLY